VFLGESLTPTTWIGLVAFAGVAAMTLPARKR
jgi:drug/metabolite transporter (DMT)-like permease